MATIESIVTALADLEEAELYAGVQKAIDANTSRNDIIESLQAGMAVIGERFAAREYFISELMLSAEMFVECQNLLGGEADADIKYGAFVLGTAAGDVHDIGKNIVAAIFRSSGFKVIDLGVDVPAAKFVEAVKENDAKVIGISCLLTTAFDAMKEIVDALKEEGLAEGRLIMIGGGPVNDDTLAYTGADFYDFSAQNAVQKAIAFLG